MSISRSSAPTPPPTLPVHRPYTTTTSTTATTALALTSISVPGATGSSGVSGHSTPPPSPAILLKSSTSTSHPTTSTTATNASATHAGSVSTPIPIPISGSLAGAATPGQAQVGQGQQLQQPPGGASPSGRRRRKPLNPIKLDDSVPAVHFRFPIVFPPSPEGKGGQNQDGLSTTPGSVHGVSVPLGSLGSRGSMPPVMGERPVTPVPSPLPSRLKPQSTPSIVEPLPVSSDDTDMRDADRDERDEDMSDLSHSHSSDPEHSAAQALSGMRIGTPDPGLTSSGNPQSYTETSHLERELLKDPESDPMNEGISTMLSSSAPSSMRCEVLHYPLLLPHIMRQKPVIRNRKYYTRPRERNVTVSVTTQQVLERTSRHLASSHTSSALGAGIVGGGGSTGSSLSGFHSDDGRKRRSPANSPFSKKRSLGKGRTKAGTPTPSMSGYSSPGLGHVALQSGSPSLSAAGSPGQTGNGPETIVRFGQVLKRLCKCCGATKSPQGTWRTGWEETVVLCNGCGLRYKNTKVYCKNCSYIPTKGELTAGHMVCKKCGNELTRNTNPPPGSSGRGHHHHHHAHHQVAQAQVQAQAQRHMQVDASPSGP